MYAMTHEINALLDQAYLVFLSSGLSFAAYSIVGVPYKVDFTQMLQVMFNFSTVCSAEMVSGCFVLLVEIAD